MTWSGGAGSRTDLVAELVDGRGTGRSLDLAQAKMATVDVAVADLDRIGCNGRHLVEHEPALDLRPGVLVAHSSGEGAGEGALFAGSIGLMIPTSMPFGSATIAYHAPQNASYGTWRPS